MVRIAVAAVLALATSVLAIEASEAGRVGQGNGDQFITGQCASDADCASGCCAADNGKCAAFLPAQERQGCGFQGNGQQRGNGKKAKNTKRRVAQPLKA